jgi:hypothetical protein
MCVCLRVQGSERPPLYITPYPLVSISNHRAKPFRIVQVVGLLVPVAYFLPDFLMPWEPVFMGPLLLPTLPASSSRAFLSIVYNH